MIRRGISKVLLILLVFAVFGFDRHMVSYCDKEIGTILSNESLPTHADLPVLMFDYHEDISIKSSFIELPDPAEKHIDVSPFYHITIRRISPGPVWQPPEQPV